MERSVRVTWGDNTFHEAIRLGDLRRGRLVHLAVEAEDAAEGAERVALVSALERLFQ